MFQNFQDIVRRLAKDEFEEEILMTVLVYSTKLREVYYFVSV